MSEKVYVLYTHLNVNNYAQPLSVYVSTIKWCFVHVKMFLAYIIGLLFVIVDVIFIKMIFAT